MLRKGMKFVCANRTHHPSSYEVQSECGYNTQRCRCFMLYKLLSLSEYWIHSRIFVGSVLLFFLALCVVFFCFCLFICFVLIQGSVSNVACVFGLSIPVYHFDFLYRLFYIRFDRNPSYIKCELNILYGIVLIILNTLS